MGVPLECAPLRPLSRGFCAMQYERHVSNLGTPKGFCLVQNGRRFCFLCDFAARAGPCPFYCLFLMQFAGTCHYVTALCSVPGTSCVVSKHLGLCMDWPKSQPLPGSQPPAQLELSISMHNYTMRLLALHSGVRRCSMLTVNWTLDRWLTVARTKLQAFLE